MHKRDRENNAPQIQVRTVLVSPEAWEGLDRLCRRCHTGKQMSAMLVMLPADVEAYVDRRPQEWKDQDVAMLEHDQWPLWTYDYARMHHNVTIAPSTIDKLVTIARHFCIVSTYHKTKWDQPLSRINALLEALGLGLLAVHLDR
jgi:hypothetical protein